MNDDRQSGPTFRRFVKRAVIVVVCTVVGIPVLAFAGFVIYALLYSFHA